MPLLTINLLGPPNLLLDDYRPCSVKVRKAEALVYYCVLSPRPVTVLYLRDLLWPDMEDKKANQNFNDAFYNLKKAFETAQAPDAIVNALRRSKQGLMEFDRQCDYVCDVEVFESLTTSATTQTDVRTLQRALDLYRGPFLEPFVLQDAPGFDAWVEAKRQTLAGAYRKLLHLLGTAYLTQGNWPDAIQCLERLREALSDPSPTDNGALRDQEVVCGVLMMCHVLTSRLDLARQAYEAYLQAHQAALTAEAPSATLEKLHAIIQTYQPANLRIKALVAEALQRLNHRTMEPRLEDALNSIYLATGAQRAPTQGATYRTVLQRAQAEAGRYGAACIGTPHLVLALCDTTDADCAAILDLFPCSMASVAQAMRTILAQGATAGTAPAEYTLALQHVLQIATDVAGATQGHTVELRHFWVALLQEEQGLLSQILAQGEADRLVVLEQIEDTWD